MTAYQLLTYLTELLERNPSLTNAEVVFPIVDSQNRKERTGKFIGKPSGPGYEKIYSITHGATDKGLCLIMWPVVELTHEYYVNGSETTQQQTPLEPTQ